MLKESYRATHNPFYISAANFFLCIYHKNQKGKSSKIAENTRFELMSFSNQLLQDIDLRSEST